jgi:hypothetical protein
MKNIQEINCYLLYAVNLGDRTHHSNCPKKQQLPIHKKQKNTLLSPIQSSLTSLLHPGISMRGYQIEDYLELVIEGKDNMSYIQTHIPPELCHHGIFYWDSLLETNNPNSAKMTNNYITSTAILRLFLGFQEILLRVTGL